MSFLLNTVDSQSMSLVRSFDTLVWKSDQLLLNSSRVPVLSYSVHWIIHLWARYFNWK